MSLNRHEQLVYDYFLAQVDERRHWEGVVKREAARATDPHQAAHSLETALWNYYVERAAFTEPFRSTAGATVSPAPACAT